jgi:hypothetical protein
MAGEPRKADGDRSAAIASATILLANAGHPRRTHARAASLMPFRRDGELLRLRCGKSLAMLRFGCRQWVMVAPFGWLGKKSTSLSISLFADVGLIYTLKATNIGW